MKARVMDGCISCGACVTTCPEAFSFDEDGLAEACGELHRNMKKQQKKQEMTVRYL